MPDEGVKGAKGIKGINRARFLSGAAAVGVAGVAGSFAAGRAQAGQEPAAGRGGGGGGVTHRGVLYEVGSGESPATGWNAARMRADMRAVRDDLHLTKTLKDDPDDPHSDWHWEPKEAFHAVSRHYGRHR